MRCAIAEREEGISYDMRAMNNSMRTMEHMRRWGIAERIRECSRVPAEFRRDLVFCTALHGHELGVFRAYGFRPEDARELAAEPGVPMSQKYTARVLRARAVELGCELHAGAEFSRPARGRRFASLVARRARTRSGRAGSSAPTAGAAPCAPPPAIAMAGAGGLGKHVHAVIGCPGLLEDLPVSAGCFYVLFNPQVGGLVLPSDVDEFNLHLAGYEPDAQVTVEELAAKARIVIGRDADVEVRRSSPYLIHELTAAEPTAAAGC